MNTALTTLYETPLILAAYLLGRGGFTIDVLVRLRSKPRPRRRPKRRRGRSKRRR